MDAKDYAEKIKLIQELFNALDDEVRFSCTQDEMSERSVEVLERCVELGYGTSKALNAIKAQERKGE